MYILYTPHDSPVRIREGCLVKSASATSKESKEQHVVLSGLSTGIVKAGSTGYRYIIFSQILLNLSKLIGFLIFPLTAVIISIFLYLFISLFISI